MFKILSVYLTCTFQILKSFFVQIQITLADNLKSHPIVKCLFKKRNLH